MKIVYTGEKDTRLFKEALGQTIGRLLEEDPDVLYLDADLMSCIGTAKLPGKNAFLCMTKYFPAVKLRSLQCRTNI